MDYLKLFNTVNDAVSYELSSSYVEPYCSYSVDESSVRYDRVICWIDAEYEVTDAEHNTVICVTKIDRDTIVHDNLFKVVIDGSEIDFDINDGYISVLLSSGTHNVQFYFLGDEIGSGFFNNIITLKSVSFHGIKRIYDNYVGSDASTSGNFGMFASADSLNTVTFDGKLTEVCDTLLYRAPDISATFESDYFKITDVGESGDFCEWLWSTTNSGKKIPGGINIYLSENMYDNYINSSCEERQDITIAMIGNNQGNIQR